MESSSYYYSDTYEASRRKFIASLALIRQNYPDAQHFSHSLSGDPSVSIDWIMSEPSRKEKAFILTSGQHGIEGYTGAAIQQLFLHEFMNRFNPQTTGLLLVHAINPHGMKYRRKVNINNVDLNRNFNILPHEFDPHSNPAARKLEQLVYPAQSIRAGWLDRIWFILRVLGAVIRMGQKDFMAGALMGQFCFPEGMYFGGREPQEETLVMMDLFRSTLGNYPQALHLDMHSGYGPRYRMSLVNSTREPASSAELVKRFNYPLVQKTDASEFYTMHGDMIDYLYRIKPDFPNVKRFYSSVFEFGTYGDSLPAGIRSLRTMVYEMQARRFGTVDESSRKWIEKQFDLLYDERNPAWVEKAFANARQAFNGILTAEGFITQ